MRVHCQPSCWKKSISSCSSLCVQFTSSSRRGYLDILKTNLLHVCAHSAHCTFQVIFNFSFALKFFSHACVSKRRFSSDWSSSVSGFLNIKNSANASTQNIKIVFYKRPDYLVLYISLVIVLFTTTPIHQYNVHVHNSYVVVWNSMCS